MIRALIKLAVFLVLAITSTASGARGGDLRAATRDEISVANEKPTEANDAETSSDVSPHVRKLVSSLLDASEVACEQPGPSATVVKDVLNALMLILVAECSHPDDKVRLLREPLHTAALRCMGQQPAPAPSRTPPLKTAKEFRESLFRVIPICFRGLSLVPLEMVCGLVGSAIMQGSPVNKAITKLVLEDVRSNLLRHFTEHPPPQNAKPEDLVEAVLKAAGLPAATVDNIIDGGQRMKKHREQKAKAKRQGKS